VERQIKEFNIPNSTWSEQCNLFSEVVNVLYDNPEENISSVHQFFSDVWLSYPSGSDYVRNVLLVQDKSLLNTTVSLLNNKNTAMDAVKLMDQVILKIIIENKDNMDLYNIVHEKLLSVNDVITQLLNSDSLILVLAGTKLVQAFVNHKLEYLLKTGTLASLDIFFKLKLSNVIHTVVANTICTIIKSGDIQSIMKILIEGNLIDRIIGSFNNEDCQVAYRGHLRIIANNLKDCTVPEICDFLKSNQAWSDFLLKLQQLNEFHVSFKVVDNLRRRDHTTTRPDIDGTGMLPHYLALKS